MLLAMNAAETDQPTLREARAAVFAAVCVLVGAVGHDAFSASGIPAWALGCGAALAFLTARPLTRRERGLPTILAAMAVVQIALHELFASAQHHAASSMTMPTALPPRGAWWCGHDEPSGLTQAMLHATGMPPSQHSMTAGMWAAHVASALIASWWLRRGEAAVWSLARALTLALIAPLVLLVASLIPWTPPRRVRAAFALDDRVRLGRVHISGVTRRGPPAMAAASC